MIEIGEHVHFGMVEDALTLIANWEEAQVQNQTICEMTNLIHHNRCHWYTQLSICS